MVKNNHPENISTSPLFFAKLFFMATDPIFTQTSQFAKFAMLMPKLLSCFRPCLTCCYSQHVSCIAVTNCYYYSSTWHILDNTVMYEQAFKNIDDTLWKDSGCSSELDYIEQTSCVLFLKFLLTDRVELKL
jgi:hypothetical protein